MNSTQPPAFGGTTPHGNRGACMTRPLLLGSVALALLAAGCMHSAPAQAAASPVTAVAPAPGGGAMMGMCPMDVPGTHVSAADTENGEALTFTTTADQAAELQRRVRGMADMHNQRHAAGGTADGAMKEGMMGGAGMSEMMMPPPSHAAVMDLPDGARLEVTPNASADLQKLQSAVRMHAQHMQEHGCGMMMKHTPQGS
jgi:hypothetical protein